MIDFLHALTNAGTGGILGIAGAAVSGWLKIKGMKAQAEIEREMVKLQIDKGTLRLIVQTSKRLRKQPSMKVMRWYL